MGSVAASQGTLFIDPIQVTFKGGTADPLHGWYPYLEGYSPLFVEQILEKFAPNATRILDPFGGTGTTPLTIARLGGEGFYCEVNPLLQYLIETKALALTVSTKTRGQLVDCLLRYADEWDDALLHSEREPALAEAYQMTFGTSTFFDELTYDSVLRARTVVDSLNASNPPAARLVMVAILASLVPASRLIRRGDLRFKTAAELEKPAVTFSERVKSQLRRMASDLARIVSVDEAPILVCEDARTLATVPGLELDAVITSPPYLNGTNYFRNTKIELWFLRYLQRSEDLAAFRLRAVTSGINDVTVGKVSTDQPQAVQQLVKDMEVKAYDGRIPRMVGSYFAEMKGIFSGLKRHLKEGAVVAVDIGDSAYGGVHVPTHSVLVDVLAEEGYQLEQEVVLRNRTSRSGFPLKQVLLVFRFHHTSQPDVADAPRWTESWDKFKDDLPHQKGESAKRNWGHPLHSLCSYQGKMKPSLASHLVRTFVPAGGTVLDPFAGVGTIPFEAALQGIHSWGFEISPAAYQIATAKVSRPEPLECEQLMEQLTSYIATARITDEEVQAAQEIRFNGPLPDYFEQNTFSEILLARRYFRQHRPQNPSESLVFAALLHILHGNRPYALSRRSHPITPFAPSGPTEYRSLISRLRDKVGRSIQASLPETMVEGRILMQDATAWWPHSLPALDAVITSPPFFDSTRFYLANWMRLWFSGWEARDFREKPTAFIDERQKVGFEVYHPIFRQARERLKPGGVFVLHLGKSRKCDMAKELSAVASRWFSVVDMFSESVEHCESHGIRDKGSVSEHQYIVLR